MTRDEDKSVTFRKRRLSFPRHHLSTGKETPSEASPKQQQEHGTEEDQCTTSAPDKASTFRKRRLSLSHKTVHEEEPAAQRRRRSSASVTAASSSSSVGLKSIIVHAGELLGQHPPPSPANNDSVLYHHHQPSLPPLPLMDSSAGLHQPRWKKRHHVHEEHKLPFPRGIVGTYSCHGVEPVYDSDYGHNDDDEDYTPEGEQKQKEEKKEVALEETNDKEEVQEETKQVKSTMAAKINQDRGGIAFPYGDCPKTALFAVYDGHGQGGELVSQYALHEVQRRLEKHPLFDKDVQQAFRDTFLAVDDSLRHEPLIEPLFAGTTACVALLRDKQLSIANVGDSRAVLARKKGENGDWEALDLTVDQNPDLPEEHRRITQAGGFVSPRPGPGLSARVWLDTSYSQIGLAMARSIGDHIVSPVGVIAEPIVTTHEIEKDDDFMILASDGVWEFLDSEAAVKIVGDNLSRGATKACQALIETAAAEWHREEGEYRDDITAIVVRLQDLWA